MHLQPIALRHPTSLAGFILWLLQHHAPPTKLLICGDRQSFLSQLLSSMEADKPRVVSSDSLAPSAELPTRGRGGDHDPTARQNHRHPLLIPTLNILAASQTISLAYCPSVPCLHACLSTLPRLHPSSSSNAADKDVSDRDSADKRDCGLGTPILALVNPLALHRESGAYSAQGLGKAFAAGVEAAWRCDAQLVIVEGAAAEGLTGRGIDSSDMAGDVHVDENTDSDENILRYVDSAMAATTPQRCISEITKTDDGVSSAAAEQDPWDDEVPIVSATTKTFGGAAERAWMARKVHAKDVAGRWCLFRRLDEI